MPLASHGFCQKRKRPSSIVNCVVAGGCRRVRRAGGGLPYAFLLTRGRTSACPRAWRPRRTVLRSWERHLDQEEVLGPNRTRLMPTPREVGHQENHARGKDPCVAVAASTAIIPARTMANCLRGAGCQSETYPAPART